MTTVHKPFDVRIFHRECISLAKMGFDVTLLAPHDAECTVDGVRILPLVPSSGRIDRMTTSQLRLFTAARKIDADIFHFHDPEVIPVGLALQAIGRKVVYDVHEDVPLFLLDKPYLSPVVAKGLSLAARGVHAVADRVLSGVVTVTEEIGSAFSDATMVKNYPLLAEFDLPSTPYSQRENRCVYAGAIAPLRGSGLMLEAIELAGIGQLTLAGHCHVPDLRRELEALPDTSRSSYVGMLERPELLALLTSARVGLVVLDASHAAFHTTFPIKLFEYMAAGLPVICCDIPKWADIVRASDCGIVVGSTDIQATADAIRYLFDHPVEAEAMGRRGRIAVAENYRWESQAQNLASLYRRLL